MPIRNSSNGKVVAASFRTADTFFSRSLGLMFSGPGRALVLEFPEEQRISLHMVFVFYCIDVLFLDSSGKVVDVRENFRPFSFYSSPRKALYAVELPAGSVRRTGTRTGHAIEFS